MPVPREEEPGQTIEARCLAPTNQTNKLSAYCVIRSMDLPFISGCLVKSAVLAKSASEDWRATNFNCKNSKHLFISPRSYMNKKSAWWHPKYTIVSKPYILSKYPTYACCGSGTGSKEGIFSSAQCYFVKSHMLGQLRGGNLIEENQNIKLRNFVVKIGPCSCRCHHTIVLNLIGRILWWSYLNVHAHDNYRVTISCWCLLREPLYSVIPPCSRSRYLLFGTTIMRRF